MDRTRSQLTAYHGQDGDGGRVLVRLCVLRTPWAFLRAENRRVHLLAPEGVLDVSRVQLFAREVAVAGKGGSLHQIISGSSEVRTGLKRKCIFDTR